MFYESRDGTELCGGGSSRPSVGFREELFVAKKETAEQKPRETPVEFLASLASVLVTGLFIITFIFQAFEIPSSSMENTLLIGDHVFVNRVQFSPQTGWVGPLVPYRQIRRGDI